MKGVRDADGEQHNARLETQLWLFSGLVQGSRDAQNAALRSLPDLVQLLDSGVVSLALVPVSLRFADRTQSARTSAAFIIGRAGPATHLV